MVSKELGCSAFQEYYVEVINEKNNDLVGQALDALTKGDLTREAVEKAKVAFLQAVNDRGKDAFEAFASRPTLVSYRGIELEIGACSLMDQWEARLYVMTVREAVDKQLMLPLWVEDMLTVGERKHEDRTIEECLYKSSA